MRVARRRWFSWGLLGIVVATTVVVLVVRSRPSSSPAARADRLEHQLACPVCEGQSVADSNSFEANSMRAEIPAFIRQGKSDAQIRAYYVDGYGDRILEIPANSGIGLVVWFVPAIAFVVGLCGIVIALRRWSRTPRLTATAEDEDVVRHARESESPDGA